MANFDLQAALNKGASKPITFVVLRADRDTFVQPGGANKNEVRARDATATDWDASFHKFIDARRIVIKLQRRREVELDSAAIESVGRERDDTLLLNVTVTNNGVVTPFDMSVSAAVFA